MKTGAEAIDLGLYKQRVGVAPYLDKRDLRVEKDLVKPRGIDIDEPGPRAMRIIASARGPALLDTNPALRPKTLLTTNVTDHCRHVRHAVYIHSMYAGNDQIAIDEEDDARKACIQTGGPFCWDILVDGLGEDGGTGIDDGLAVVWDLIQPIAAANDSEPHATLPVMTMSGAFDYGTGFRSKMVHTFAGLVGRAAGWDRMMGLYEYGANACNSWSTIHAIMISRTGPLAKWEPLYALGEQRVYPIGKVLGHWCRRRHVYGVPTMVNVALLRAATMLKNIVHEIEFFRHTGDDNLCEKVQRFLRRLGKRWKNWKILSDDLSGFDKSVRGVHQDSLGRVIYSRIMTKEELEIWRNAHRLPVLAPAWGYQTGGFAYTRPEGGVTTSGLICTTMDGLFINAGSVIEAVAAGTGWTVAQAGAKLGVEWYLLLWGDDTFLIVPPEFDEDAYIKERSRHGFRCKLSKARVFLKRRFTIVANDNDEPVVTVAGIGSRFFSNRVWPEHERAGPACELISASDAIDSLGPHPDRDELLSLALSGSAFSHLNADTLRELATSPQTIARAQQELRRKAHLQRRFLAALERPLSSDDKLTIEVAASLLGQPGTRRIDPSGLEASVPTMERHFKDLVDWMVGQSDKPVWYGEAKDMSQSYWTSSEVAA